MVTPMVRWRQRPTLATLVLLIPCFALCVGWALPHRRLHFRATGKLPPDANTLILLHFEESGTPEDSAPEARTWTLKGSAATSDAQAKFGLRSLVTASGYDSVYTTSYSDLTAAENDAMTVDFWVRFADFNTSEELPQHFFGSANANTFRAWINTSGTEINVRFGSQTGVWSCSLSAETWTHIAIVKNNTGYDAVDVYVNGSKLTRSSGTFNAALECSYNFSVGTGVWAYYGAVHGNIDEFRWSNVARWTSNFTPPTSEY